MQSPSKSQCQSSQKQKIQSKNPYGQIQKNERPQTAIAILSKNSNVGGIKNLTKLYYKAK
jgi:hypothetical protein